MKKVIWFQIICLIFAVLSSCSTIIEQKQEALVFINSNVPDVKKANEYLIPFLDHYGIPYAILDIAKQPLPNSFKEYAVIIFGHNNVINDDPDMESRLENKFLKAVFSGCGVVSFDTDVMNQYYKSIGNPVKSKFVKIIKNDHFITANLQSGEVIKLLGTIDIPPVPNASFDVLIRADNAPLLAVGKIGRGRIVGWTSQDWMQIPVFGHLTSLDDCLWRSIVWASRKPFAIRGLPRLTPNRLNSADSLKIVRADSTLKFSSSLYEVKTNKLITTFSGKTDVPTNFYLFTDSGDSLKSEIIKIPVFNNEIKIENICFIKKVKNKKKVQVQN